MKFPCRTDKDRKPVINWSAIDAYFKRWKPHTDFDITVKRRSNKKIASPEQRGYYFSTVLPVFMNAYGYDPEDDDQLHRHLKCTFFRVKPDKHGVYREKDIPSVFSLKSDIGMKKRGEFIDWVIRKSAEAGKYTPSPGE